MQSTITLGQVISAFSNEEVPHLTMLIYGW